MGRRATLNLLLPLLLALPLHAAACGPRQTKDAALADTYWERLRAEPDVWELFLSLNQKAALAHGNPHDAAGIEFQARAVTAQSGRAARVKDRVLAAAVAERVGEIRDRGLLDEYEATLPGSRERFLAAERAVADLLR